MEKNIVSVIIPVYNAEKYMRKGIDSVLNQTYKNIEVILINDGSKDKSAEICDEYAAKDSRVRVLHKDNGGVSTARNAGIECASGKYITFVDSDDTIPEDAVETLIKPLIDNSSIDYSAGNVFHYIGEKQIYSYDQKKVNDIITVKKEEIASCIFYNQGYAYAKIYVRDIILKEKIRFNNQYSLGEDSLFVKQYLLHINGVAITQKCVYNYLHKENESLSKKYVPNIAEIYSSISDATNALNQKFGGVINNNPKIFSVTNAEITNIYKSGSPINNRKERINFIKARISDSEFKKAVHSFRPTSRQMRWVKFLYYVQNAGLIDMVYSHTNRSGRNVN